MALPEEMWIKLVLAKALELRQAGILHLSIGDRSVTLAALEQPAPAPEPSSSKPPEPEPVRAPIDDPHSFPDGLVPGFTIDPELPEGY